MHFYVEGICKVVAVLRLRVKDKEDNRRYLWQRISMSWGGSLAVQPEPLQEEKTIEFVSRQHARLQWYVLLRLSETVLEKTNGTSRANFIQKSGDILVFGRVIMRPVENMFHNRHWHKFARRMFFSVTKTTWRVGSFVPFFLQHIFTYPLKIYRPKTKGSPSSHSFSRGELLNFGGLSDCG